MIIPNNKKPFRVWVNQPSRLQAYHKLHGQRFLAVHEYDDTFSIYYLSGDVWSQQITRAALSFGWPEKEVCDRLAEERLKVIRGMEGIW